MEIHNIGKVVGAYASSYTPDSLGDYEIEPLESKGVEKAWYWYGTVPYEGAGQLLAFVGGRWVLHDMGHCSCYGPTEHFSTITSYASLDEVAQACSAERVAEVQPLIDAARAAGEA